jgi:hypothetical protein
MKKSKRSLLILALMLAIMASSPCFSNAADYIVKEVIGLRPGHNQTREFELNNTSDITGYDSIEPFLIIAAGDNDTQCGELTISLSTSAKNEFGAVMTYGILGIAYPLGGAPELINEAVSTPNKLKKSVTIDTIYGIAYVGALIINVKGGDFDLPATFTMSFDLSERE